jgi:hypothetical protein
MPHSESVKPKGTRKSCAAGLAVTVTVILVSNCHTFPTPSSSSWQGPGPGLDPGHSDYNYPYPLEHNTFDSHSSRVVDPQAGWDLSLSLSHASDSESQSHCLASASDSVTWTLPPASKEFAAAAMGQITVLLAAE